LRSNTARLRKDLQTDREIIVTANGRPFAVMTGIEPDRIEDEILALRRARAQAALSRIRAKAKADGLDRMTQDEINAVITRARHDRRATR
jgi:antitoxin (DNA-binding transcriptional repressor) of toxin-antitoxin stability system